MTHCTTIQLINRDHIKRRRLFFINHILCLLSCNRDKRSSSRLDFRLKMATRRSPCVIVDGCEVLHDGIKSYWKYRTNLEILICSHNKYLCIEIIAYNADTGIEAPRLYVNSALLTTKINMDDFENNVAKKKEVIIRQKKSCNNSEISKLVYNEMMVSYILTRLNISPGVDLKTDLKIVLTPMISDVTNEATGDLDIISFMPYGLKPVVTTYHKNFRYSRFINL